MTSPEAAELDVIRPRERPALQDDRFHEVLAALRRISRATDLHSKHLLKSSGLTIPQVIVLQSVRDLGEVTTGQISERVSLSQGTVTSILDRLESRKLIERYRSVTDRRVVHARLTRRGRNVLKQAPPILQERFVKAFGKLDPRGQHRIISALQEVAEMMGAGHLDTAALLDDAPPRPARQRTEGA